MSTTFLILGIIAFIIVVFIVYRIQKVKKQHKLLSQERFERIRPLFEKLESGQQLTKDDVLPYAKNVLTRELAFELLKHNDNTAIFPEEYNTLIKGAESRLANWLEFPTELGACPDEMEHIKRVTFDFDGQNNLVHYEVFKYRFNEPHWAAKDGWILGVVGPYFDDSKPYDNAQCTFSRVSGTVAKTSPEEEAKWVHENLSMRR
jgi:hypothetical protein